jgi:hypothetical protein
MQINLNVISSGWDVIRPAERFLLLHCLPNRPFRTFLVSTVMVLTTFCTLNCLIINSCPIHTIKLKLVEMCHVSGYCSCCMANARQN